MKLVAEYLDRALQFERMADATQDPQLRDQLTQQAAAYRKLATKTGAAIGPADAGRVQRYLTNRLRPNPSTHR
jgi:hypothetical protein